MDSARPRRRDRELLAWLEPKIGQHMVRAVADREVIDRLRKLARGEGWSFSTVDRLMNTVRAVLRHAQSAGLIDAVPTIPMYGATEHEPRWLTPAEFEALCSHLPRHLELAARLAVLTGLRMRAMLGLTWDRIDLQARKAWVPASQMKGRRTHPLTLSSAAVEVLGQLRALNPTGRHVFQWEGKPIDNCHTRAFKTAVQRAGVAPFRWHDLRHTFAAWAVQSGVTLQELMALGGWSSYRMALRYGHLAPAQLQSAAERVAQHVAQSHTGKKAVC